MLYPTRDNGIIVNDNEHGKRGNYKLNGEGFFFQKSALVQSLAELLSALVVLAVCHDSRDFLRR